MSLFEEDTLKNEKMENIIESLLRELDKADQWNDDGYHRVQHKQYNLNVDYNRIRNPHIIKIPRKWKRIIARKICAINRYNNLEGMDFTQAILDHQYPIQIKNPTDEQLKWCKENKIECKSTYGYDNNWIYIKEGDGAMDFKLKGL